MKWIFCFVCISLSLSAQNAKNVQDRILSNDQVKNFLGDSILLRNLNEIYATECDTAKCSYQNNFFETLFSSLKKNIPKITVQEKNKIMTDLYSPDEKFYLSFGGDEFDRRKNEELKAEIEDFFSQQFFSLIFCMQKYNPVYDFDSKFFLFRIFENIHQGTEEFLTSDIVEISVLEDKAEKIKKNFYKNAIVCKFKLDVLAKTESYGVGLIYRVVETECGMWESSENQFYAKEIEKSSK